MCIFFSIQFYYLFNLFQTKQTNYFIQGMSVNNKAKAWRNLHSFLPCRATIRLAKQSGTLVPAAKKVMPIMTSGMPIV